MPDEIVPVVLGEGRVLHVQANVLGGTEDVGDTAFRFDDLRDSIIDIGQSVSSILEKIQPKSASVEFGVEVAVESGKLTALLVKGSGKANLKFTLSWGK